MNVQQQLPIDATGAAATAAMVLAPIHLIAYSTLLGTELYQSFVMTKVCFQALPKTAFTTLQKRVFPMYFKGQSMLMMLAAATLPPYGPLSLVQSSKLDWVPFAVAGVTAVLNLVVYEPRTRGAMVERIHQETRDKRQADENYGAAGGGGADAGPSLEMQRLNRLFSKNHAMCIHLNLVTMGAMLFYGVRLASRINFAAA